MTKCSQFDKIILIMKVSISQLSQVLNLPTGNILRTLALMKKDNLLSYAYLRTGLEINATQTGMDVLSSIHYTSHIDSLRTLVLKNGDYLSILHLLDWSCRDNLDKTHDYNPP